MMAKRIRLLGTTALVAAVISLPAIANAQAAGGAGRGAPPADAGASSSGAGVGLEEIVVTAQRRSQNLQDVPLSVVAVTQTQIQERNIQTLEGLNTIVPNAAIEHVGIFPNAAALSMRGVGYAGIESFTDPEVAVYINGIYQSRNNVALATAVDVQSLEVLRGPQGTLYGRNAFAGVITLQTAKPEMSETTGEAVLNVGNYGLINADFIGNVPIIKDKVALRLVARSHVLDGYYHNDGVVLDAAGNRSIDNTLKGRDVGGERYAYFRPSIRLTPNDALDITLTGEYYRDRSDAGPVLHLPLGVNNYLAPPATALTTLFGLAGSNPFGTRTTGGDGSDPFSVGELVGKPSNLDQYNLSLDIAYNTSLGTLRFLGNVQSAKEEIWTNSEGENINRFSSARWQDYDAWSGEFQFVSNFSDRIDLILDALALHDNYNTTQFTLNYNVLPLPADFSPQNVPDLSKIAYINNNGERTSYAAYAQGEFHFNEQLSLVLGGRYSTEKKYNYLGQNTSLLATGFGRTVDGTQHLFSPLVPILVAPSKRWSNFAPRVGVNYKANEDFLLYAFWQRAFKSGGFNANAADLDAFRTPYGVEKVDSFEGGFKSEWLDRRLRINANVFYSKFNGLQRSLVTPSNTAVARVVTVVQNAANLTSYGVESEIGFKVDDTTTVYANIGWNKAYYTSYCSDIDGPEATAIPINGRKICGSVIATPTGQFVVPTDNTVQKPIRAPRWDIAAGVTKYFYVGDDKLSASVNGSYRSGQWTIITNLPYGYRDPMFLLDASLRYEPSNARYTVTLWGRNLTNRVDLLNYSSTGFFGFANPTFPRTYGATVDFKF